MLISRRRVDYCGGSLGCMGNRHGKGAGKEGSLTAGRAGPGEGQGGGRPGPPKSRGPSPGM